MIYTFADIDNIFSFEYIFAGNVYFLDIKIMQISFGFFRNCALWVVRKNMMRV